MTRARPGRVELMAVGALFAAVLTATLVTYSRVSPAELYHVSHDGIAGGLSRALVELNFPDALVAVPVALVAIDVIGTRWAAVLGGLAVAACLVTAAPGVVDAGDLDAKAINVVPALGVVLAVALVAVAAPRLTTARPRLQGDVARLVLAAVIAVAAIPYCFAVLGFYAPDPVRADEPTPGEPIASVHLGNHEGMAGALIALAVLMLSRLTPWFAGKRFATVTSWVLALLLTYGVANLIQDDWHEQVVKRGWTEHMYGTVTKPAVSVPWLLILAAGVAVELLWFRRERRPDRSEARAVAVPAG
jgi:hypothetical protein